MSGINSEEDLTVVDDLMVSAGITEQVILSEITDEMENGDKEDDDDDGTDPSQSLLTSQEALESVRSMRAFFIKSK
ncbi:hypothetical protein AVEN_90879-1 [Araneus ventricosus]|uniref:Uncharacterized protein n=1 Tax=Araneus ventricosus TaxID=182803 RepID=A0A4Y2P2A4_ARAVE|nr:hypothetical protein AVEN_90879-1 [Araneus ventricosus]